MARSSLSSIFYGTHFEGVAELATIGMNLEGVSLHEIQTLGGQLLPEHQAVIGNATNECYSVRSDVYVPVMNNDVIDAVVKVCNKHGLVPNGVVNVNEGRMNAYVFFNNVIGDPTAMSSSHKIISVHGEEAGIGLRVFNSYTGQTAFGAEPMMVRFICSNGAFLGSILSGISMKHTKKSEELFNLLPALIEETMGKTDFLSDLLLAAEDTPINLPDLVGVLWGLNLPKGAIDDILKQPEVYEPNLIQNLNALTAFNAVTAYITYRDGAEKSQVTETLSHKATDLLTLDLREIIDFGEERKQKYEENLKEQQLRRDALKIKVVAQR